MGRYDIYGVDNIVWMKELTRETVETGLSYDDVLLVPQESPIDSRSDVDLQTTVAGDVTIERPILSAAMDTITEEEMAIALGNVGCMGIIHRFLSIEEQVNQVTNVINEGVPVGAAVGINEESFDRANSLASAGVDVLVLDVAHGHMDRTLRMIEDIKGTCPSVPLIAGNVVTESAVDDMVFTGVDGVKIGVGPGSHCTTRKKAGVGMPQLTAVSKARKTLVENNITDVTVIADGGIRQSGDAVKALAAGADTVMMGGFFGGMHETPGEVVLQNGTEYKQTRGMATKAAVKNRDNDVQNVHESDEGVEGLIEYEGSVEQPVTEFCAGIRSGLSYIGASTIPEAHEKREFIGVSQGARLREGSHYNK